MIISNKESQVSATKMIGYLFLRQYKNTNYVNHCSDISTPAHPAGRTHHKDKSITPPQPMPPAHREIHEPPEATTGKRPQHRRLPPNTPKQPQNTNEQPPLHRLFH